VKGRLLVKGNHGKFGKDHDLTRNRMARARCSPSLPPEIVEKILINVLKREDSNVDILRLQNPFVPFFRCRGVNRLWRDCADNLIRKLGKSPDVELSNKHKEYLFRDEYFAQLAPTLGSNWREYWDDPMALFKDHRLTPHYRDFLIRTLALRSPHVTDSRTIRLCPDLPDLKAKFAAISTDFAAVAVNESGTEKVIVYDLNGPNDAPIFMEPLAAGKWISDMEIISDIAGKEQLIFRHSGFKFVSISWSDKRFTMFDVPYKPGYEMPRDAGIHYRISGPHHTHIICISDKPVTVSDDDNKPMPTFVKTKWPSFEAVKGNDTRARRNDVKWVFCHGTLQIFLESPSQVTIKVLQRGRGGSGVTYGSGQTSFNPLALFQGGRITEARFESNVLFLGTSNGFMLAYILRKHGVSNLDLAAPDFSYRHELAKPVKSISIARCNRDTGMVRILVCYSDRLQVITKMPSTDFSQ